MIIEKPRNEMNKSFGEAIPFFIKKIFAQLPQNEPVKIPKHLPLKYTHGMGKFMLNVRVKVFTSHFLFLEFIIYKLIYFGG